MFTQITKWLSINFNRLPKPRQNMYNNNFRIVKQVYLDEYITELIEEFTLEQKNNFSWSTFKDGFRSEKEALDYYYKIQEYISKTGFTIIPIVK